MFDRKHNKRTTMGAFSRLAQDGTAHSTRRHASFSLGHRSALSHRINQHCGWVRRGEEVGASSLTCHLQWKWLTRRTGEAVPRAEKFGDLITEITKSQ